VKRYKEIYLRLLALRDREWPIISGVGKHFLYIMPIFNDVAYYASTIQFVSETLDRLLSNNPKFVAFTKSALQVNPGLGQFDLPTLLRWPLQTAQTLQLRLTAFLEYTPDTPPFAEERADLAAACQQLQNAAQQISQAEELAAQRARVFNAEYHFVYEGEGLENALNLLGDVDRTFIRESPVIHFDSKKKSSERHLIMFNDLLIIGRGQPPAIHLNQHDILKLDHYFLVDNVDLEKELGLRGVKTESFPVFKLVLDPSFIAEPDRGIRLNASASAFPGLGCSESVWYLSAPTAAEKQVWFLKIQKQMALNKQVFGVDLTDLLTNETVMTATGIPKVVAWTVAQLQKRAMSTVGLFRVSPEKTALAGLLQRFNRGLIKSADELDLQEISTISEVLKVFFRQLPEPLFTWSLSEEIAQADDDPVVPALLARLPGPNRLLLDFLMRFLAQVSQYSETNKMTPSNVAIVFGPNLIRSRDESLESSMRMPRILSATAAIVNYYVAAGPPDLPPETDIPPPFPTIEWATDLCSSDEETEFDPFESVHIVKSAPSSSIKSSSADTSTSTPFPGIRVHGEPAGSSSPRSHRLKEVEANSKSPRALPTAPLSTSSSRAPKSATSDGSFPGIKLKEIPDFAKLTDKPPASPKSSKKGVSASLSFRRKTSRPTAESLFSS
jgi:hypothetical protein